MVGLDRTVGHKVGLGGAKGERSMRNVGFSIVLAFPSPEWEYWLPVTGPERLKVSYRSYKISANVRRVLQAS